MAGISLRTWHVPSCIITYGCGFGQSQQLRTVTSHHVPSCTITYQVISGRVTEMCFKASVEPLHEYSWDFHRGCHLPDTYQACTPHLPGTRQVPHRIRQHQSLPRHVPGTTQIGINHEPDRYQTCPSHAPSTTFFRLIRSWCVVGASELALSHWTDWVC